MRQDKAPPFGLQVLPPSKAGTLPHCEWGFLFIRSNNARIHQVEKGLAVGIAADRLADIARALLGSWHVMAEGGRPWISGRMRALNTSR